MKTDTVKIKICGIRRTEDIDIINRCLPDYAGFVFAPASKSKRAVTPDHAADLMKILDPAILRAGVFVDEDPRYIIPVAAMCRLDVIQLHGSEDLSYMKVLKYDLQASGICAEIWKAVRIGRQGQLTYAPKNTPLPPASRTVSGLSKEGPAQSDETAISLYHRFMQFSDAIILDTFSPGAQGGTGETFDWELIDRLGLQARAGAKMVLAGGLTPENVRQAIDKVKPFAADVSSGVETEGFKDEMKVMEFIKAVRK